MRSGTYFILKGIGVILVAVAILILTVFISNFALFSIRISGHVQYLHQGLSGFAVFLRMFPWHLLLFDIALMLFLQQLLKQFRFGYRVSVGYIYLAIIILAVSVSLILDQGIRFNDELMERAHHHELLEPFNGLYDRTPGPRLRMMEPLEP